MAKHRLRLPTQKQTLHGFNFIFEIRNIHQSRIQISLKNTKSDRTLHYNDDEFSALWQAGSIGFSDTLGWDEWNGPRWIPHRQLQVSNLPKRSTCCGLCLKIQTSDPTPPPHPLPCLTAKSQHYQITKHYRVSLILKTSSQDAATVKCIYNANHTTGKESHKNKWSLGL